MSTGSKISKIDELMNKASESLARTAYFEAERMANRALLMARQENDYDRMARILLPLQEARRQRYQQALDAPAVTILDRDVTEDMPIDAGCYLLQPPLVGADARRFRLEALRREIPVAVICREPTTQLKLCPVVAIGPAGSIRTQVDLPEDESQPDVGWLVSALRALGEQARQSIDQGMPLDRLINALLDRLDTLPEDEDMHQELARVCRDAAKGG
jgi:hypothetical protein